MKKLLFICFAFIAIQLSAQDLNSMAGSALGGDTSSLIDGFAADQVKSLTKKLNLSEAQQEQVSGLVVSTLKSDKFKKLLGNLDPSALMGSSDKKAEVKDALMKDENFKKGMNDILTDEQKTKMKS
ncbi:MAG: hypothetical protein KC469_10625 [Flavobacteriaceae bacterium]|jgi:hypothetical protein|nr:hypothetical protein [Flavobacteriaceae bacterium]